MAEQTGATPERLALAARVADLRTQGLTYREVAVELDISRSYASMLATDPAGAGQRRRRDSYDGVCLGCGGATKSDGTSRPSDRCAACRVALQSAERKWTREAVIDAIQRFAATNGRPPKSSEWVKGDPVNGYPTRSAVYGAESHNPSSPFAKWADAIEAAGFARPLCGHYPRRAGASRGSSIRTIEGRKLMRDYIILELDEDGRWIQHEPVQSYSEALAIEKYVQTLGDLNGRANHKFIAVSAARWVVRELQPVTSFKAVAAA